MKFKHLLESYFKFLKIILTGLFFLLTIPVFLQIVSRYVAFVPRYIWTEEVARFAFVWIILVGSTVAVRENTHFSVDIFSKLTDSSENVIRVLQIVFIFLFAVVFFVGGIQFAQFGAIQRSSLAGLPMVTIFIAWPLAGLSWIFFLIEQFLDSRTENA